VNEPIKWLKEYDEDRDARYGRHDVHGDYCINRTHKSLVMAGPKPYTPRDAVPSLISVMGKSNTQKEKALDTRLGARPKLCDLVVTGLADSIS